MDKTCYKCKKTQPLTEFYKNRARHDGVTVYCKTCHVKLNNDKHTKNPEYKSNYHKTRRFDNKIKLFKLLDSNKCIYCNFAVFQALQIEHINGDGSEDKRRFGGQMDTFMKYYLNHPDEAKEKLQITCANCNWIKRFKNEEDRFK